MPKPIDQYSWKELEPGFVVTEPGSAREYKTGDWRSTRPVWDDSKCNQCWLCWLYCPEAAVYQKEDGYFTANLDYCKGCGICAQECPRDAIKMVEER